MARVVSARGCHRSPSLQAVSIAIAPGHEQDWSEVILSIEDITALKAQETRLDLIAHHDPLTGLPNRRLLTDRLSQALALAERAGSSVAVCSLDLDGFKPINDRCGHAPGDRFLIAVAEALKGIVRAHDSVARIGGDEFVLLFTQLNQPEDCSFLLERALAEISKPITLDGVMHRVTASIGISLYPIDANDPETLLRCADQAMYWAKSAGRNCYRFYHSGHEPGVGKPE